MMYPYVRTLASDSRLTWIGTPHRTSNSPRQSTFTQRKNLRKNLPRQSLLTVHLRVLRKYKMPMSTWRLKPKLLSLQLLLRRSPFQKKSKLYQ